MNRAAAVFLGGATGFSFSMLGATFLPWSAWQHAATLLLIDGLVFGCSVFGCALGLCLHGLDAKRKEMALIFGPAPGRHKVAR